MSQHFTIDPKLDIVFERFIDAPRDLPARVLRQPVALPVAPPAEPRAAMWPVETVAARRSTPPPTPAAVLPPPEIRQITEQVIRAIDHRIAAERERFGRR